MEWRGIYSRSSQMKRTQIKIHRDEEWRIRASIDMKIPNQFMKQSRCVQSPRPSTRLRDLSEAGSQTRSPPVSSRPLQRTSSSIQHTLAKLQIPTTSVWSEITSRCLSRSHVQNLWRTHHCVNQGDDTPLGKNGPDRTYRSAEDRPKESEKSQNQL